MIDEYFYHSNTKEYISEDRFNDFLSLEFYIYVFTLYLESLLALSIGLALIIALLIIKYLLNLLKADV